MKKYKKVSIIIILTFVSLFFYYHIINTFVKMSNIEKPLNVNLPVDYKNLFNTQTQTKIKHICSQKFNNKKTYPISRIKIGSIGVNIFKYQNQYPLLKKIQIEVSNPFILRSDVDIYSRICSSEINQSIRTDLTNRIDTIYIHSTQPIDTLLFNPELVILKGVIGNLNVKVDTTKKNADQYFENSLVSQRPKYYLVWIKKEAYVYELFIDIKEFDDKRILSLFK